ncbi:MAG: hypothetical protein KA586_08335 [Candidatus Promineofilum sp.]|nr:hypothetical protein [Promineifilum sp.]
MDDKHDLLHTKLYIPPARSNRVARPRLCRQLDEGLGHAHPLVLISAPAGYGKTTLIADCLRSWATRPANAARIAWVSLDEGDNAPANFFAYVVAAVRKAGLDWQPPDQALWYFPESLPVEAIFASLLNETGLLDEEHPLILVLDDYHKIHSPVIHESLQFALDFAGSGLHIILITREDPPLTLSRWRARGQLTEIRAADLRFTPEEAEGFLNHLMGLDLSNDQLGALEHRTEGWIAGLQLAALALKSPRMGEQQSGDALIASFSGAHHYVIDYLLEEVLRQQEAGVRDFLRQTSALDRLSAGLCNAVTGRDDSGDVLRQLDRANLFLIPLDERREWYRYHHLMADSLRVGLDQATRMDVHRRAAHWHEAHRLPAEAMHHAQATGDPVLIADILERIIREAAAWSRGHVSRLTGWLDGLPHSMLLDRPALCLHASRALYLSGQMERAEGLLRQAELSLGSELVEHQNPELPALAITLRAAMNAMRGENLTQAAASMRRLLSPPHVVADHTAARAADTLGLALELTGDVAAAEQAYRQAGELAHTAGVTYLTINARCEAALMQIQQGRLAAAEASCRLALDVSADDDLPPKGLAWMILGEVARERDDLAKAARLIPAGIELAQKGGIVDDLRYGYLFLARLSQAQDDPAAATTAWHRADSILRSYGIPRLALLASAHRARLDLAQGNIASAERWAQDYRPIRAGGPAEYLREFEDLTLARVGLAQKQSGEALPLLNELTTAARQAGRYRTVIEALLLKAVAQQDLGQRNVDDTLTAALALAAPEGFARLFLNEGPVLVPLLKRVRAAAPAFVDRLLAALSAAAAEGSPPTIHGLPPRPMTEPLSDREMDVLRLLAAGLSNQEIADQLIISVGTAKWHAHNIFDKLNVHGRTQAIARAREWQLI